MTPFADLRVPAPGKIDHDRAQVAPVGWTLSDRWASGARVSPAPPAHWRACRIGRRPARPRPSRASHGPSGTDVPALPSPRPHRFPQGPETNSPPPAFRRCPPATPTTSEPPARRQVWRVWLGRAELGQKGKSLAYELALPLFVVRYDAVVTSYLGETAQRLRRLFDFVRTEPCVLFFDELDAIGKERGDLHETGEIKRVVTTLLLQLDDLPSYCVLVGATNHPELLDRATWRRFEMRLELERPSDDRMTEYFAQRLRGLPEKSGYTARRLRAAVSPRSFSEAEDFFLDLRRHLALEQGRVTFRTLVTDRVNAWSSQRGRYGSNDRPADLASG